MALDRCGIHIAIFGCQRNRAILSLVKRLIDMKKDSNNPTHLRLVPGEDLIDLMDAYQAGTIAYEDALRLAERTRMKLELLTKCINEIEEAIQCGFQFSSIKRELLSTGTNKLVLNPRGPFSKRLGKIVAALGTGDVESLFKDDSLIKHLGLQSGSFADSSDERVKHIVTP